MGSYWSSKKDDDTDEGYKKKKRKMNGEGKGVQIVQAKEYQILYGDTPVVIEHLPPHMRSMFVFKKTGSMYFDEDGDLAHEFYKEERLTNSTGAVRWCMKRIVDKLIPQGEVDLPIPRLRVNVPIVLLDSNATVVPR